MFRVFQVEVLQQLLGARAPRALGQYGDFGVKIVPGLKVGLGVSLLVDPFVIGTDPGHPISIKKQLAPGETGKNRNPSLFHLGRQPFDKLVDGDDIVAMIAQRRRHDR